jgi:hypothetical protein
MGRMEVMLEGERMCVDVKGKFKVGAKFYMRRKQNWTLTGFTDFSPSFHHLPLV